MKKPKYKIGDCVIAKAWLFYNLFIVIGGFWDEEERVWKYTISRQDTSWFSVKHCRHETEIRNLDLKW